MNNKIIELASELAHKKTVKDLADLYSEDELWIEINGGTVYKRNVQEVFNDNYDYYYSEIEKVFKEPVVAVINSCDLPDGKLINQLNALDLKILREDGLVKELNFQDFANEFNNNETNTGTDFIRII